MQETSSPITILLAEDDDDDYFLIEEAFEESMLANHLIRVKDGEELMAYLFRREPYTDLAVYPWPGLILLDLNMPRKDGREALQELKASPELRKIPVVVLTTSSSEEDIVNSYDLGVNSFIRKPVRFEEFLQVVKILGQYWFQIVRLPTSESL